MQNILMPQFSSSAEKALDDTLAFPFCLTPLPKHLRFGNDALLLAAYACASIEKLCLIKKDSALRVVELGCADGTALLGISTRYPAMQGLGLDVNYELIGYAKKNAGVMECSGLSFVAIDLNNLKHLPLRKAWENKTDLVLANPPWRFPDEAHRSASEARNAALWAQQNTLAIFCKAAASFLKHHGHFCCITDPATLPAMIREMEKCSLGLREIKALHPYPGTPASRLFLRSQKNAKPLPCILPPLILHERRGGCLPFWSEEALGFCPWLRPRTE